MIAGHYDVVVAGGVESMSRVPMFSNGTGGDGPFGPMMTDRYDGELVNQGVSAEMIAEKWDLSRQYLDEMAVDVARAGRAGHRRGRSSPRRSCRCDGRGHVTGPGHPAGRRRWRSWRACKTPFAENGVVTAGNASQISDGSAALLVMTSEKAAELGLTPIARFHTGVMAGVDPVIMLTGPIPATQKVLERSGLTIADIGAFEVNEAFASVVGGLVRRDRCRPQDHQPERRRDRARPPAGRAPVRG